MYSLLIQQPQGTSVESRVYNVDENDVEFLYDLTFEKDGQRMQEKSIFDKAYEIIDTAERFIIVDMFLFNNEYDRKSSYPDISYDLAQRLIDKKRNNPDMEIVVVTDEINTFYGSYDSEIIKSMESEGIKTVFTKLEKMRDSNHIYSGFWRVFLNWNFANGKGWFPNPFSPDSPKVTLCSYLKLFNFKANHRKVLATESEALISSANPHDASAFHSNIAFAVKGDIIKEIVDAENVIASWAESDMRIDCEVKSSDSVGKDDIELQYITEETIGKAVTEAVKAANKGDSIDIAMFYLSDRKLVEEIINAANRDVKVSIVLDSNKDAFGRQKNGIPNRVVAYEIHKKTDGRVHISWYKTNGEQFHSKIVSVKSGGYNTVFGGSANMTRRNIRGYNLEADIKVRAPEKSGISADVDRYFQRLYDGDDIKLLNYKEYAQKSILKNIVYRFQEWSGLSTF